jgi:predicted Zn-dependent peptidase
MDASLCMMRTAAPAYKEIKTVHIIRPELFPLDNGTPLYALNTGTQDVVKIIFLFGAGSLYQPAPLVAFAANSMLPEGSAQYTAEQISEINDFYGAVFTCSSDKDWANVTLLTLRKRLDKLLPVLEDVLNRPAYREQELQALASRHSQRFLANEAKNEVIAHKRFLNLLFGNNHPYGYELQLSDFEHLDSGTLQRFYENYYRPDNCRIVVAGRITEKDVHLINKFFGNVPQRPNNVPATPEYLFASSKSYHEKTKKPDSVQSSLRLGKQVCNRSHADFFGMTMVNTLLGGYFGSRLMRNIREDKGYTYGINSRLVPLRQAAYFSIVAETGAHVTQAALTEIYAEIERLQQNLAPDDELQLARTFLMSELFRSFDGPFAQAESLISLLEHDQDANYCEQYMESIRTIDAEEVRCLAQKYLDVEQMYEITVGA